MRKMYIFLMGKFCASLLALLFLFPVLSNAQISLTNAAPTATQNFDGIGTSATAALPTNWKALNNTTSRQVDAFLSAGAATTQRGGNLLSSSAGNGIYNFGAGDATTATDRAVGGLSSSSASKSVNIYTSIKNDGSNDISSLAISFDVEKYRDGTNAAGYSIQLYYSTDGTTWTSAGANFLRSYTADATVAGYAAAPGSSFTISNTLPQFIAAGNTLYLAWNYSVTAGTTTSNAQALGIDNFSVTANFSAAASATISANPALLTGFATPTGTASASQTITVGGANLTDNILITAPAAYEVSTDNISFTPTVSLNQVSGSVANTTVYTRIATTASPGTANGTVSLTSAGATTQNISLTGSVLSATPPAPPVALTATAISINQIDLTATGNSADDIIVAWNTANTFGTPAGALSTGNSISGGGTVLYKGTAAAFGTFNHTGRNAGTTYYYSVWSVDAFNTYSSSAVTAQATTNTPPIFDVVINQVYGGGGNSGSVYKSDFIELYNNENVDVDLTGSSVQYGSASGTVAWNAHVLSGVIKAKNYFLIKEASGTGGTTDLPTADATGILAMGAASGKVLLSNVSTAQTGANPTSAVIMDKIGYGTSTNGFETIPTNSLDANTAAKRTTDGVDTDNNEADFTLVSPPLPRNSLYISTAPIISTFNPANNSTSVPYNFPINFIFDKPIVKGTAGSVIIYEDAVPLAPIAVTSTNVVISSDNRTVSIINTTLASGKTYYIEISAGAFEDTYGNDFAGISGSSTWTFTTYNSSVAVTPDVTFDLQGCTGTGLLPSGFSQYSSTGDITWDCNSFGRDPAAPAGTTAFPSGVQINGYANGTNVPNIDWFISPSLNLTATTYPLLSFYSRTRFNGAPLQLKISTDYTGTGNPALATWTDLNGKFPGQTTDVWTLSSGINLSNYKAANVHVAFVYTSTDEEGARWSLDDISIINSAVSPPPSITVSTTDVTYNYVASGSTSNKTFAVTGNDITTDMTITSSSANFLLSKDGVTFTTAISYTIAEANNITKTVYVQFVPAATDRSYTGNATINTSSLTTIVSLVGTSIDPAKTLDVVNWNVEWFGSTANGPTNETLQRDNVTTIMQNIGADIFGLVEIVDQTKLDYLKTQMPGYDYVISDYGSYTNPNQAGASPLSEAQKQAFFYKTSVVTPVSYGALLSQGINSAADLTNPAYNYFASGRFPFMMTANVTLNGITKQVRFVLLHAKANTSPTATSYARRKAGSDTLHYTLNNLYPTDNVMILGDINDDLDQTITDGITPATTSYVAFTTDNTNFSSPTLALSLAGKKSTVSYDDVIDHVIISNEWQSFYMNATANILSDVTSLVSNYGSTTSDHYPVFTRFAFDPAVLPVELLSFKAIKQNQKTVLTWETAQEINAKEFIIERSTDGRNFTSIGTVAAAGNSSVTNNYNFIDQLPIKSVNYYRLRQVDIDQKFEFSSTLKVIFDKAISFSFLPNPAKSTIYLTNNESNKPANVELLDGQGRVLKSILLPAGSNNFPVDVKGFGKGFYLLRVGTENGTQTHRLLLQ